MMNLQKIKFLHPPLTQESAHILVRGLVTSHLDYCNAIFYLLGYYLCLYTS